jgi:hypothetical protein
LLCHAQRLGAIELIRLDAVGGGGTCLLNVNGRAHSSQIEAPVKRFEAALAEDAEPPQAPVEVVREVARKRLLERRWTGGPTVSVEEVEAMAYEISVDKRGARPPDTGRDRRGEQGRLRDWSGWPGRSIDRSRGCCS